MQHTDAALVFTSSCSASIELANGWLFWSVSASIPGTSNKLGEWLRVLTQYAIFLSNRGCERNEIWQKARLGGEDDARTLNTLIAQRKLAIPHSTMTNTTGKQTHACALDLSNNQSRYLWMVSHSLSTTCHYSTWILLQYQVILFVTKEQGLPMVVTQQYLNWKSKNEIHSLWSTVSWSQVWCLYSGATVSLVINASQL